MFEHGIQGGFTQAVHKQALANNKYMGDCYNPSSETCYLQYLDANNLYRWAMSQPLPTGRFKWVKPNEVAELTKWVSYLTKRENKGYLLEVEVSYPRELHDSHNDLPFMCKRMKINSK